MQNKYSDEKVVSTDFLNAGWIMIMKSNERLVCLMKELVILMNN